MTAGDPAVTLGAMESPGFPKSWLRFNFNDVRFLLAVAAAVCVTFAVRVLADYDQDTTEVSNGAFALSATLAGLCFAYVQVLPERNALRRRLMGAGERCFRGTVLLLLASLTKYAMLTLCASAFVRERAWLKLGLTPTLGFLTAYCFCVAVLSSFRGFKDIVEVLFARRNPEDDLPHVV